MVSPISCLIRKHISDKNDSMKKHLKIPRLLIVVLAAAFAVNLLAPAPTYAMSVMPRPDGFAGVIDFFQPTDIYLFFFFFIPFLFNMTLNFIFYDLLSLQRGIKNSICKLFYISCLGGLIYLAVIYITPFDQLYDLLDCIRFVIRGVFMVATLLIASLLTDSMTNEKTKRLKHFMLFALISTVGFMIHFFVIEFFAYPIEDWYYSS